MQKFKSIHIDTKTGGGDLDIFKNADGYLAKYQGTSGLAHVKELGHQTPCMANIDFELDDTSYDNLIEKCRTEIEKRDSRIIELTPIIGS